MTAFLVRRLLLSLVTGLAVLTLVFALVRVVPGDPAQVILGDLASEAAVRAIRARLGLDQPLWKQYATFLGDAVRGDWGVSMATGRPVLHEVATVLPWTIELTVAALLVGTALGVPLGVWSALHRNRAPDYLTRLVSLLGLSCPPFVLAVILLLVFAVTLRLFPVISAQTGSPGAWLGALALPALNLGLITAAYITRVTRSAMLDVLPADYVRAARAKGLREGAVVWRHALRNALIPVITIVGLHLGILIGNSVMTEIVFSRPGLGKLIVGALNQRDYTMLQGMMVIYTLVLVVVNVLTDLAYGLADPRVSLT